ncbi:hypothetical protein GCM10009122_47130 [Fulvivirga kasyanovii]|uniref:Hemerythrin-like domain-containing protein n=1 Tax=Fulvivirga kasyanovii TaxID=396812 RepID=A0ABW9RME0_9BACT|nr:hypothetical protein [Fulvivirga kasyanovii]MTI25289.1 hypothetical protein [Fulvivirga kasyanovii]
MENNLNNRGIEEYCDRFCEIVASQHFNNNQTISGKEILELQEIRQINLFVIKYLLSEWTKEVTKLKSPYFNYDAPEAKTALKEFMNILSRHISVEKEYFMPLLKQATRDTLLLIFSPYDYYMHLIHDPENQELSLKELKRMSKYVKINNNLLQALIGKIEEQGYQRISEEKAGKLLNEVFQNIQESPADTDEYLEVFSRTLPLTEAIIYGESSKTNEVAQQKKPLPKEKPVNEIAEDSVSTINDKHSAEQKPTIADSHRNRKIESIRKHISINQRFMFINTLFYGDEETYNRAIDYLDNCEDKRSASLYLASEYPEWDKESEEVGEFMELLEKRLA